MFVYFILFLFVSVSFALVYKKQTPKRADFNKYLNEKRRTGKRIVIDDYKEFVDECLNERFKNYQGSGKKPVNLQVVQQKRKKKKKNRVRNRMARKSRQINRKRAA